MKTFNIQVSFSDYVRRCQKERNIATEDIADRCGISTRTLARRLSQPLTFTVDELLKLRFMLGWSEDFLIERLRGARVNGK